MSKKETATPGTVVTGMLFLNSMPFFIYYLISGSTHSFISTQSTLQLDLEHAKIQANYRIKLPNDCIVDCLILYKNVPISLDEFIFPVDLIWFDLSNFDILLGIK